MKPHNISRKKKHILDFFFGSRSPTLFMCQYVEGKISIFIDTHTHILNKKRRYIIDIQIHIYLNVNLAIIFVSCRNNTVSNNVHTHLWGLWTREARCDVENAVFERFKNSTQYSEGFISQPLREKKLDKCLIVK